MIRSLSFLLGHRIGHAKLLSTRIVCISDTHSNHDFTLPDGDILIHAGDLTYQGKRNEFENVLNWLKSLTSFRLKIIIAGNHDFPLDEKFYEKHWRRFHYSKEDSQSIQNMFNDSVVQNHFGIIYLYDQTFLDRRTQLKFYGSPWQPEFHNWAFNITSDSENIRSLWNKIPFDTNVLITHTPPYGIRDVTMNNMHVGCKSLYDRVQLIKPKLHVFGHIYEAYGRQKNNDQSSTIFVNASTCNLYYQPVQSPIVIEL